MSAIFARLDSRGLDYLRGRLANAVGLATIFRSSRARFDIQGDDIAASLDEVVSGVVAISVSAYDGESLVIWQGPACHVFTGC